ncbi:hypothetical protein ES703_27214 [subsurface metagenome]
MKLTPWGVTYQVTPIGELGVEMIVYLRYIVSTRRISVKLKCSRCKRVFGSAGALRTHELYSKRCGSREMAAPASPAAPIPTPEKGMPRGKKWDPNWSDGEKRRYLLEKMPLTWGIGRRRGKWEAVPVPGAMTYSDALIRSDERNSIDRLFPPVRRRVREEVEDEEETLALGLLMLELMSRRV